MKPDTKTARRPFSTRRQSAYRGFRVPVIERLESRALLTAGSLDPTFGIGGRVVTDFGGDDVVGDAVAQADGKIVVVGTTQPLGSNRAFLVARYNTDGSLDDGGPDDATAGDAFASGGRAVLSFPGVSVKGIGVALQSDGRIVVAGTIGIGTSQQQFVVFRLNADGSLDDGTPADNTPSDKFGPDGRVIFGFDLSFNEAAAVLVQPGDQKIVVAGTAAYGPSPSQLAFALARFNADGRPDDGSLADADPADHFGVDGNGRVLIRFDTPATPFLHTPVLADIGLQPDGGIVAAGKVFGASSSAEVALARVDVNGVIDLNFGQGGQITDAADLAGVSAVAVQADGKIIAGGPVVRAADFELVRFLADGSRLDATFGASGIVQHSFGFHASELFDLLVQPDGKIVAGGVVRDRDREFFGDFAVSRFGDAGSLDPTFGDEDPHDSTRRSGTVVTDFAPPGPNQLSHEGATTVIKTSQGLVAVGEIGSRSTDVALARYDAGAADAARVIRSPDPLRARTFGFSLAADGNVLVVGDPEAIVTRIPGDPTAQDPDTRAFSFDVSTGGLISRFRDPSLNDPTDIASPLFGLSLAIAHSVVAVGAPGTAKVHYFDAHTGQLLRTKGEPVGHADGLDRYGDYGTALAAVDIDPVIGADSILVGAPEPVFRADPSRQGGYTSLERLINGGETHSRIFHPVSKIDDYYGQAVAGVPVANEVLADNYVQGKVTKHAGLLLVGDPLEGVTGRAYVLTNYGGPVMWTLDHPAPRGSESFGAAVAAYGADFLVGAPGDSVSAIGSGAVYHFDGHIDLTPFLDVTPGRLVRTYLNPSPDPQDHFGFAIASLGNYVLVGAPHDDAQGTNAGAVHVFDGVTGDFVRTFYSPEPRAFQDFGFSIVAVGPTSFAVGAPSILFGDDPGVVYVFDIGLPIEPPRTGAPFQGTIQGTVWNDRNQDGVRDPDESGVPGVRLHLEFPDEDQGPEKPSTVTGADGRYEFPVRYPGIYTVAESVPRATVPTAPPPFSGPGFEAASFHVVPGGEHETGVAALKTLNGADLNGDQLPDLITTGDSVAVQWNDPFQTGGFRTQVVFDNSALDPADTIVADVNGDGRPDLVVRLAEGPNQFGPLAIVHNTSIGTTGDFVFRGYLGSPSANGQDVVAADFNGDELTDLAFAESDDTPTLSRIQVLLQDRNQPGGFLSPAYYNIPAGARALAAEDMDHDGDIDLAVTYVGDPDSRFDQGIQILLSNNGTFINGTDLRDDRFDFLDLVAVDLDLDGFADLAAIGTDAAGTLFNADGVFLYLNLSSQPGTFGPREFINGGPVGDPVRLTVAYVNAGDAPDLFAGGSQIVREYLDVGAVRGSVVSRGPIDFGLVDYWYGDLNRDEIPEMVFIPDIVGGTGDKIRVTDRRRDYADPVLPVTISPHEPTATADFGIIFDSDGDGVDDQAERQSPLGPDANLDALVDAFQRRVSTLQSAVNDDYVTFVSPPRSQLTHVAALDQLPPGGGGPAGASYPLGFFSFTVENVGRGSLAKVEMILHSSPSVNTYVKFDSATGNAAPFTFDAATGTGAVVSGNRIELYLRDGGRGDADGLADGRIVDPGGPALVPPPTSALDAYAVDEDQTLTVAAPGLLTNDTRATGDALMAILVTNVAHGTLSLQPDGSFTYIADADFTGTDSFTYRATDGFLVSEVATVTITVNPADDTPVQPFFTLSTINGPRVAVPGQLRSYSVSFSDGNPAASYTATIDWGDGTVSDGYVAASTASAVTEGRVSFWHTYKALGDRAVRLTLRDGNGNVRTAELPVTVQLVTFQPDPLDATKRALVVGGFDSANDQIVFQPDARDVRLSYNGYNVGPFAFDGSIVAFGQGGDDNIRVDQRITRGAMLFGQEGNDILVGSAGTNVLVGGAGNDQLFGYAARDLLFGGLGADVLNGHGPSPSAGDSDLLCSDYAAGEYDPSLLASLHNRWQSPASYADRLHNLRYAAYPALNNTTVFNDYSADRLIGGAGLDWFLFSGLDELVDVEEDEQGLGFVLQPRRR